MKKIILLLVTVVSLQAADITGREVINNLVNANLVSTTKMSIKLIHTQIKNDKEKIKVRELNRYHKRYTDGNYNSKSLLQFTKPDIINGTGFLVWAKQSGGNDQWLFLPKVKSARKIEAQEKTKSFMNTEFSYEDLESFNQTNEQYFLNTNEKYNGRNCFIVEIVSHSNTQYKKRLAWIDEDWLLRKVEFYNKQNKLYKILTVDDYINISNVHFTQKMTMKNVQTGSYTVMDISDIEHSIEIPDNFFTIESLENPK